MLSGGTESTLFFFFFFYLFPKVKKEYVSQGTHPKTLVKKGSFEKQLHHAQISLIIKVVPQYLEGIANSV